MKILIFFAKNNFFKKLLTSIFFLLKNCKGTNDCMSKESFKYRPDHLNGRQIISFSTDECHLDYTSSISTEPLVTILLSAESF